MDRARRALAELERARAEVQPAPGTVTGIVTVGLLSSTTDLLAEPLMSSVARQHPDVRLRLMTAYSGHLQQWLDGGDLDLTLLYNLDSTPSLNARPLVRERLWAVAPASAGLRGDRPVPFAHVAQNASVMPASGHALRNLIDTAAARAGADLKAVVETNSMRVQKRFVRAGHGWTVLPGLGIAEDVRRGAGERSAAGGSRTAAAVLRGTPSSRGGRPSVTAVTGCRP